MIAKMKAETGMGMKMYRREDGSTTPSYDRKYMIKV